MAGMREARRGLRRQDIEFSIRDRSADAAALKRVADACIATAGDIMSMARRVSMTCLSWIASLAARVRS